MRIWSPRTRNYWGQKRKRDSIPSDQDESDTSGVRSPMPWEPQDTTQESTNYKQEENAEDDNYGNTPSLETIVITPEPSSPIWENGKSVIDTLKGKPPEDIDPQNFIQKIVSRMLGNDENAHKALNRRAPKILDADISGPMISADSPDGKGGRAYVVDNGKTLTNIPKVLGNVITGPVISADSPDLIRPLNDGNSRVSNRGKAKVVLDSPVGIAQVSSEFGKDRALFGEVETHGGTDYSIPVGTPIFATAKGVIIRADYSSTFGNVIIIDHGSAIGMRGNVYTLYAHGLKLLKLKGDRVIAEDVIMLSGNTGSRSKGPHLHYEVILYDKEPLTSDFYKVKDGSASRFMPSELIKLLN
jgi:murein DD-endopeptidase MepM/ murein hydrolase activator NlpD